MYNAQNWYEGNYINQLYPNANLTSQNINKLLTTQAKKNSTHLLCSISPIVCKDKPNIVIDSTGLPNEINMPLTDWGHHSGKDIEYETRLILAIDRKISSPCIFAT
ncbi:MAG: hypothetical protein LBQ98_03525 [Nitrososphaerota archaeon]|jgi:hypothetical protein|nr:hypothetical protein [Nitrososphaerota archaeon]